MKSEYTDNELYGVFGPPGSIKYTFCPLCGGILHNLPDPLNRSVSTFNMEKQKWGRKKLQARGYCWTCGNIVY